MGTTEMTGVTKRLALRNCAPGGGEALATRAAFSAIPLNSLGVQARTISILDSAPDAATAIPMATASDPSASSETSTTSFEPVVLYSATSLPPAFSINALTAPDRSDGLLTSPFTPEWEYDAYVMNRGILLLPVLSVDSGRGIFHGLIAHNSTSWHFAGR